MDCFSRNIYARAHTSRATITWLEKNIGQYIPPEDWPQNTPDLSPIENWGIMTTTVYADPEPQTLKALECRLCKVWRSISMTSLQNLVSDMPDRLKVVVNNKGDTIRY